MNKILKNGRKLELYINLKYSEAKVTRGLRFGDEVYDSDVRMFIVDNDHILESIIRKNNLRVPLKDDETVKRCAEWVKNNTEYTLDYIGDKKVNNFQMPNVTAQRGKGDCDDTSILLVSLAICAGVPYYRLKLASGTVKKSPTAPTGGHMWVLYYDTNGDWQCIESTSKSEMFKGKMKDLLGVPGKWYNTINYTVNKKHTFAQKEIKPSDGEY